MQDDVRAWLRHADGGPVRTDVGAIRERGRRLRRRAFRIRAAGGIAVLTLAVAGGGSLIGTLGDTGGVVLDGSAGDEDPPPAEDPDHPVEPDPGDPGDPEGDSLPVPAVGSGPHEAVWVEDVGMLLFGASAGEPVAVALTSSGEWLELPESPEAPEPPEPGHRVQGVHWTGENALVWVGYPHPEDARLLAFDPRSASWTEQAPSGRRVLGSSVWTGDELLVWGGDTNATDAGGVAFDPAAGTWRDLPESPLAARSDHTTVWTGTEMIVWGGINGGDYADGAAYDPARDQWRAIADAPVDGRMWHTAVWTGTEMIVWGGRHRAVMSDGGAAYHPGTDTWRELPAPPIGPRERHTAVWTGSEMIVWGGFGGLEVQADGTATRIRADGAAYNPATDQWRLLPPAPLEGRDRHAAVWTGEEMIVHGGTARRVYGEPARWLADAAAFNPDTGQWRMVRPTPAP